MTCKLITTTNDDKLVLDEKALFTVPFIKKKNKEVVVLKNI